MLSGLVFSGILIHWLIYVHPAAPFLLSLWFALWFGVFGILCGTLESTPAMIFRMPVAWTAVEYLRSIGPFGFAWGLLGHTQYETLGLIQIASVTGVYGLSFVLATLNGMLAAIPGELRARSRRHVPILLLPLLLLAVVWLWGGAVSRVKRGPGDPTIRLALLQVCFSQMDKWDDAMFERVKARTYAMSAEAAEGGVDLIVWPETALPVAINRWPTLEMELAGRIREWDTPVLVGTMMDHGGRDEADIRNTVILYRPGTASWRDAARYEKVHLVPWGEYVPFRSIMPFVDRLVTQEGGGGLTPGEGAVVIPLDGVRIGVPICFESAVADLVRQFPAAGANLLINVTNDAWFRESSAQDQHAIQSVFRAVENGRAVARAANTGRTCWISPAGEIVDKIPLYEQGMLVADVPLRSVLTFYTRFGDLFGRLIVIALAAALIVGKVRRNREEGKAAN
jgi:apolipoprotein N-acyltransferase